MSSPPTASGGSPASVVAEMKYEFPRVAAVLTAAETVWNEVADGLRLASDNLDEARRQAPGLADPDLASALVQADASLRELREVVNSDPLSLWRGGQVDTGRLGLLRDQAVAWTAQARWTTRTPRSPRRGPRPRRRST